jgi:hypothetical protein
MTPFIFAQAATNHAASAFLGLGFVFLILAALYVVLWFYCIINAATRSDFDTTQRLIWILVLLFLHGIGPFIYLIFARRSV